MEIIDKKRYQPREKKTAIKNSIGRLILVALMLVLQLVWLIDFILSLNKQYPVFDSIMTILAVLLVLAINENTQNLSIKAPMMIVILIVPIVGVLLFVLMELSSNTKRMRKRFSEFNSKVKKYYSQDDKVLSEIKAVSREHSNRFRYLKDIAGFPVHDHIAVKYYSDASDGLAAQIEDLHKAEKFIFLEYHAIEDKESFEPIKEILIEKAKQGVEVRILYDDIGSFVFINFDFIKRMKENHIRCRVFNPIMPFFNLFINNRDHRKITIIDGKVGFTGGYNLANEYFNITSPYGHWKDTGVRLEGKAVYNLTAMFLEMWNSVRNESKDTDVDMYFPEIEDNDEIKGYVCPYGDSPIDDEPVGENVYINIINGADEYVWFITPYLMISEEMKRSLTLAATRGVDVRIITPGIPDKRIVNRITKSYYHELVRYGVRIYEYTPGFCHAKMCVSDDDFAVCGTINLDYRSLYHHFENAVMLYDCDAVSDIKEDFIRTFDESRDVTEQHIVKRLGPIRVIESVMRLLAPFL